MRLDVIDEYDIVEFVGYVDGKEGQRCAVYFFGCGIAIVSLDKYVRVALLKCKEGYGDYYTALWNKVRK